MVLALKAGRTLGNEQIAAVINMVAGSVASLEPSRVSLVDQAGSLLSARVDLSEGYEANQGNEAQRRFQDEARRNVRDLLAPVLGDENYRLSVTAEVDNDRIQETHEQFGDAPKLTNEAMREEQDRERIALGIPGSLSNRPVGAAAAAAASAPEGEGNTSATRKNAATRQFAYDRNITQIKRSRGRLARLNVAVLLNNAAAPGGSKAWTPDEIAKVEKLLASGLGINATRGDRLTVSPMNFPAAPAIEPWYLQRDTLIDLGAWLGYALAFIAGYLLLARPLLRLAQQALARPAAGAVGTVGSSVLTPLDGLAAGATAAAGAALPSATAASGVAAALPNSAAQALPVVPLLENYELPPPGSPVDVLVDHLKVLAAKEPERVAEVVKQWVQKKNGRSD